MHKNSTFKDRPNEMTFSNHSYEFLHFFHEHKLLCDQLSGIKSDNYGSGINQVVITIGRNNFDEAIKKLRAFIISNCNYVTDYEVMLKLIKKSSDLWGLYDSDKDYKDLMKNHKEGSQTDFDYTKKYFYYLLNCFELASYLEENLQNTIMVSPHNITKNLDFVDNSAFNEELFAYKKEVADELSFFRYENLENHIKKILGYYYSYKFILKRDLKTYLDKIVLMMMRYFLSEETQLNIYYLKQNKVQNIIQTIKEESNACQEILLDIYNVTNEGLSERNILPKIRRNILVDRYAI